MLVHDFLETTAARIPDKTALVCSSQRLSYGKLNESANRVAASLMKIGVKRQDRVVILLENSIEAVISLYAVLKVGAVFVMLNPGMKAGKLNFILKDSGACVIITHQNKRPLIEEAVLDAAALRHVIYCGSHQDVGGLAEKDRTGGFTQVAWDSMLAPFDTAPPRRNNVIDLDLATIIYTSGSTGEPKGVVSAHYNVVAAARSITGYLKNLEDDIILNTLPLSFDYGLYQVLMAPFFGGTVVLEKSFVYPYKIIERLVEEKATGFPIVPTMAAILLRIEGLAKFDFSSLRYVTNTAAALPVPHIRRLQNLFPAAQIYSMYGLTECKRVAYLPPEELCRRPSSVGIPIPNEEVFIVDDNGYEVGPFTVGELVVRGLNVMQGYWNRPEETARTFRPGRYRGETFLYTGDLFKKDNDGFLYFVARKDDMIKTKGERVSPKEIENALCSMPGVSEAVVIGIPDEILGQAIKAFIVPEGKIAPTTEQVMGFCFRHIESFMVPKHIEFRTSLPKSASGKIDRKALRAEEENAISNSPAISEIEGM